MSHSPAQSIVGINWAASALGETVTLGSTTTVGNIVYLPVVVKSVSGTPGLPSVADAENNVYQLLGTLTNATNHLRICLFAARVCGVGTALTVTPAASQSGIAAGMEFNGYSKDSLPVVSASTIATGTGTAAATNAATVPSGATALMIGVCVNLGASATITPGGSANSAYTSALNVLANVSYLDGVTTASPTMTWTLGSSQSWAAVCFAVYTADFNSNTTQPTSVAKADYRITAQDVAWSNGKGVNGSYGVSFGNYGALVNWTGNFGTIMWCATSPQLSADDAQQTGNGAYNIGGTVNIAGQITTDQTDNNGDGTFSESTGYAMAPGTTGAAPVVYALTFDHTAKTYSIRVNRWPVLSGSYAGTALTPLSLFLFAQITLGEIDDQTYGILHELRIWSTPQSAATIDAAASEMAWPLGNALTKRFSTVGHNNTGEVDTPSIGESDDASAWANLRQISFVPPVGAGGFRDADWYYDKTAKLFYISYTSFNFSNPGASFGIAKSNGDLRLWVPHCQVDMSSVINPATQNVWRPRPNPPPSLDSDAPITDYLCFLANATNPVYRVPITSLSGATFGSIVTVTGALSLDPIIVPPSTAGNPSASLYRSYRGANPGGPGSIGYQTATGKDGTYGSTTTIDNSTGHLTESPYLLPMDDGSIRLYFFDPQALQWGFFPSTDNGSTYASTPTWTTGATIASGNSFDHDGVAIDLKPLGLWPAASGGNSRKQKSRLGMRIGLGL